MGSGCSVSATVFPTIGKSGEASSEENFLQLQNTVRWRHVLTKTESKLAYQQDGSLPEDASNDLLALRVFLEDPVSLRRFAKFALSQDKFHWLQGWIAVMEFKAISRGNSENMAIAANDLFTKHLDDGASCCEMISKSEREYIHKQISLALSTPSFQLPTTVFDNFGQKCLVCMELKLFQEFRTQSSYQNFVRSMKDRLNRVRVDDFDYMELLGHGSFGWVVHCRKKTTGKHYAMKVQSKLALIESFPDDPQRVTFEREASAKCNHPYIVSLDYALQTDELAMMVTSLGTGDTLRSVGIISEERTQFYAAEIVLALDHIHSMGMIYRDLKPANVLLNADGHIQLIDLGGIIDVAGVNLGAVDNRDEESAALFAGSSERFSRFIPYTLVSEPNSVKALSVRHSGASLSASLDASDHVTPTALSRKSSLKRATSVMGTYGYMAPEMLLQMMQNPEALTGYTKTVDYWSLGVLLVKLLLGRLPFQHEQIVDYSIWMLGDSDVPLPDYVETMHDIMQVLESKSVSESCRAVVSELLQLNENRRLGKGKSGLKMVKSHSWFSSMDWEMLELKLVSPPVSNASESDSGYILTDKNPDFESFDKLVLDMKQHLDFELGFLSAEDEQYFKHWDYVSLPALRAEMAVEGDPGAFEHGADLHTMRSNSSVLGNEGSSKSLSVNSYFSRESSGSVLNPASFGTTKNFDTISDVKRVLDSMNENYSEYE